MMTPMARRIFRSMLSIFGLLAGLSSWAQAQPWTVAEYQIVSSTRVGRTDIEFVVKASITNGGQSAAGVTAAVRSTNAATIVLDNSLTFGDVDLGAKKISQDTFSLRQDRRFPFEPSTLLWEVQISGALFNVAISSPTAGVLANTATVQVSGATSTRAASVKVNGVAATLSGNSFTATVPVIEGGNTLTAVAADALGNIATASVNVTRDTERPRVAIDSPLANAMVTSAGVAVTGIVNDTVIGTVNDAQVLVTVNGVRATVTNRTFLVANVPLSPGVNRLTANATDRAGNVGTSSIELTYTTEAMARVRIISGDGQRVQIGANLPAPLVVVATDAQGAPSPGKMVIFKVTQNDGLLTAGGRTARSVVVATDANGVAQVNFRVGTRVGEGNHQVQAMVVGMPVDALFRISALPAPPALLVADTGSGQLGVVGKALPKPFVAVVVDSGNNRLRNVPIVFTVVEGNGSLESNTSKTVLTDSDGRALATLTLGLEEGVENNRVEARFAGISGVPVVFAASGMVPGPASETSVSGVVLDNSDVPVPGATITINGTTLSARTDAQGQFTLKPAPVGTVRLDVDGGTVTRSGSWVNLDFTLTTIAGRDNGIGMPIRLLEMDLRHAVGVGLNYGGKITLPEYPGFSLNLLPGSVTFPGGSRVGSVHATVVHTDKTPEVPNFGQQPRFIVSINPKRAIFSPAAQLCIPNLDALAPGQKTEMYSYDEDLDSFVAIGTGTVSADGTQICSDPGVGVVKGGWHCGGNPSQSSGTATASVSITTPGPVVGCLGENISVTAVGDPAPAGSPAYTWTSSDNTIVDPSGQNGGTVTLRGLKEGTATLSVVYRCQSQQESAPASITVTVLKIEITDEADVVLTGTTTATVGVLDHYKAKVTPAAVAGLTYQWKIDGAVLPAANVAIKTYTHTTSTSVTPQNLVAGDLRLTSLALFWTDVGSRVLRLEVKRREGTPQEVVCHADLTVTLAQDSDPNRNIYARTVPDAANNPNGPAAIYRVNTDHANWHRGVLVAGAGDLGKEMVTYNGNAFLVFHRLLIDAQQSWRTTFQIPSVVAGNPPGGLPKPTYLQPAGGTTRSITIYGYVRLGECATLDEAGKITVSPWHDEGHVAIGGDMLSSLTAIRTAGNVFWKWHGLIDEIRRDWVPDVAAITSTSPATGAAVASSTMVIVTFDRPVSWDAKAGNVRNFAGNSAQVTAGALRVGGIVATSVTTTDFKTFLFTLPAAPTAGAKTAVLTGTRGFASHTWAFTVTQ